MKPVHRLLLLTLACGLASCDAVFGSADFEATVSGALTAEFAGDGQALVLNEVIATTYALIFREEGRVELSFSRQRLAGPQAGTYTVQSGYEGETWPDFGANVAVYDASGQLLGLMEDITGTLTIERCTRSDLRGHFDLSGTIGGEPLAVDGTFYILRVDSGWRPDDSLGSCA